MLIRVDDLGHTEAVDGAFQRLYAEVGRERVGELPRQHPPGGPVEHRHEVHEPSVFL